MSADLLFELGDDTLRAGAATQVRRLAKLLKSSKDPARRLLITGHADPRGENDFNDALSERRARVVADALIATGAIARDHVEVRGRGEREPIVPPTAPASQQRLNRRVEVAVACVGGGT
jgi:outer membrane protein OmpA-like peptidoglycan-associated protein